MLALLAIFLGLCMAIWLRWFALDIVQALIRLVVARPPVGGDGWRWDDPNQSRRPRVENQSKTSTKHSKQMRSTIQLLSALTVAGFQNSPLWIVEKAWTSENKHGMAPRIASCQSIP
ncbi:hypothetical protein FN846DRAFT_129194 [Sphaerosporella brunnea]|uniref:Uncharacterized protein n=1 Tax=Sphaerosporella brunnea TaxID=1250544 RepID=A0A5J5F8I7_9PEZI|nr:hypothetical protein FN846DRAFT_129194 [Sphaerosporella brunnea]